MRRDTGNFWVQAENAAKSMKKALDKEIADWRATGGTVDEIGQRGSALFGYVFKDSQGRTIKTIEF